MIISSEFHFSSIISFAHLETQVFKDVEEWECKIVQGNFPHLGDLAIVICPNLRAHNRATSPYLMRLPCGFCYAV